MQGESTTFAYSNASKFDPIDALAICENLTEAIRLMASGLDDELAKDAFHEVCNTLHGHLDALGEWACADSANKVLADLVGQGGDTEAQYPAADMEHNAHPSGGVA